MIITTLSTRTTEKTRPNSLIAHVQINGHSAKALIDQQTIGANLISNKFCAVHEIPLEQLEKPISIQMTLKGSRGSATHKAIVEINYGQYQETEEFLVCNLSNWDVILGDPALTKNRAIIVMETGRTSIMPKHVKRFELRPWSQKAEKHAKNAVTTAATKLTAAFDPIAEFPKVFPKEKDISLPPLREINHDIVVMKDDFMDVPVPFKPK